jgi:hypothetical protein
MPRSSGTYALPAGNPITSGSVANSTTMNTTLDDIGDEITNSMPRDGTAPPTADIPFGNFKLTGLGDATADTDALNRQTADGRYQTSSISQNAQSGNYTLVLTDANKHIFHSSSAGSGDTYTIPANSSVAFPIGTVVTFVNLASASVAIAITTDTMTLAGTTSTGSRTVGQNGIAAALKVGTTEWIIGGTGLS